MYWAMVEINPDPSSDDAQQFGKSCHAACWVNSEDREDARRRAIGLIVSAGWVVVRFVEEKEVSLADYTPNHESLQYFAQTLIDGEVCVIYTYPKEQEDKPDV